MMSSGACQFANSVTTQAVTTGLMIDHVLYDTLLTYKGSDVTTPVPDLATSYTASASLPSPPGANRRTSTRRRARSSLTPLPSPEPSSRTTARGAGNRANSSAHVAPSRASTLVNYVGLASAIIDYVCEIEGSLKIGKCMPGTLIPVGMLMA